MTDPTPIKPLTLTNLTGATPIVDGSGRPLPALTQTINNAWRNILTSFNALAGNQTDLQNLVNQIVALNNLVTSVSDTVTAQANAAKLANSYTNPTSVLSSVTTVSGSTTAATITVASHTRVYADGSTVPVNGATLTPPTVGNTFYVYYNDPGFHGGAVTYQMSLTASDAAQVSGIHCCGSIYVSTGDNSAGGGNTGNGNGGPGVPTARPPSGGQIP